MNDNEKMQYEISYRAVNENIGALHDKGYDVLVVNQPTGKEILDWQGIEFGSRGVAFFGHGTPDGDMALAGTGEYLTDTASVVDVLNGGGGKNDFIMLGYCHSANAPGFENVSMTFGNSQNFKAYKGAITGTKAVNDFGKLIRSLR